GPRPAATAACAAVRAAHPEVTAVAAFSDEVALRVLAAADDLGWRVPADLAVMGYDAGEPGSLHTPPLTSLRIDAEAHGRRTARRLLGIAGPGPEPAPARVVPGGTV
ncbi:MAG: substrate-binding domain-containing protein, partial [Nocardioides sp.]|uniref:substrate-binding domain-containing protein n=1 Tax=Nocardioides sp. TaxID=35761 RepID=UPI0039E2489B